MGYYTSPASRYARYLFYQAEPGALFWREAALGLVTAILTVRLGLAIGNWMRLIRR
jgi:hypothetical protein